MSKKRDEKRDYYEVLNISRSAEVVEIKASYRKLAMQHHPDRNPNNPEEAAVLFKEVGEAYEVLSNPQKRQLYDQFGHAGLSGGGGPGGFNQGPGSDFFSGFESIFEQFFGGAERGGGPGTTVSQSGHDLGYEVTLSLEEAIAGKALPLEFRTLISCHPCKGTGSQGGVKPKRCTQCGGKGKVHLQQGFMFIQQRCPGCQGMGEALENLCSHCHGEGRLRHEKKVSVNIPAGINHGDRIRVTGEGEAGFRGGKSGDLYVQIKFKKHDFFERHENDLHCEIPIDIFTAILGGTIEIPTLQGKATLSIPPETQSGKLFRLKQKGIRSEQSHMTGDLVCRIVIETPINLSSTQKEELQRLFKLIASDEKSHTPMNRQFFDRMKKFLEQAKR